ncbi:radical SAM protein [Hydrotalea sp.]|uniref:radical SAM protein n=1 Tax=Hydrotalea sp. TaxID=2881279 RepID=UPI003D134D71
MKFSKYNSIIPYNDKFAIYNAFYQKVIFVESFLKELLEAAILEGIEGLKEIHPTFYEYLINESFIVNESVDELQLVKDLRYKVDYNPELFFLTINPSMNCNFKCWYCYETHVKGSSLNETMIDSINKFCTKILQKKALRHFTLSFFGGEPLLYFKRDVIPIINHFLHEVKQTNIEYDIGFTTNGYLVSQEFIDYFKKNKISCGLQITLDGYKEKHDMVRFVSALKGSYSKIIENIKLLLNNHFFVRLRINYTDKNIHDIYRIAEEFDDIEQEIKDKYLIFDFHRVWQNEALDDTDIHLADNVKRIRNKKMNATTKNSPNNVHASCYADKLNSAVINYNGDIFKCTARDFTSQNRAGYLSREGDLVWEDGYLEKRMNSKFQNKPCLSCRILPLCNGGCSQHALEALENEEYCVYNGDENQKNNVIKEKIDEILAIQ